MQHKSTVELTKAAIRSRICRKCYQRPHGSEALDASVPRSCEPGCTIFLSLPQIVLVAADNPGELTPDELMRQFVCSSCHASASAGDFCAEKLARTCPLSRYARDVVETLEHVRRATRAPSVK